MFSGACGPPLPRSHESTQDLWGACACGGACYAREVSHASDSFECACTCACTISLCIDSRRFRNPVLDEQTRVLASRSGLAIVDFPQHSALTSMHRRNIQISMEIRGVYTCTSTDPSRSDGYHHPHAYHSLGALAWCIHRLLPSQVRQASTGGLREGSRVCNGAVSLAIGRSFVDAPQVSDAKPGRPFVCEQMGWDS